MTNFIAPAINSFIHLQYLFGRLLSFSGPLWLALFPGPFPAFQCCTLKSGRAWYAKSHAACRDDRSWRGMTPMQCRLIKVNKTGPFLCYPCLLSAINVRFEPSKDRLLLVWQRYNCASCHLLAVALTRPVTFDPRDGLDLLSPSLSITWLRVPGPPAFQRATLKSWEWTWERGYPLTFFSLSSHGTLGCLHVYRWLLTSIRHWNYFRKLTWLKIGTGGQIYLVDITHWSIFGNYC